MVASSRSDSFVFFCLLSSEADFRKVPRNENRNMHLPEVLSLRGWERIWENPEPDFPK